MQHKVLHQKTGVRAEYCAGRLPGRSTMDGNFFMSVTMRPHLSRSESFPLVFKRHYSESRTVRLEPFAGSACEQLAPKRLPQAGRPSVGVHMYASCPLGLHGHIATMMHDLQANAGGPPPGSRAA